MYVMSEFTFIILMMDGMVPVWYAVQLGLGNRESPDYLAHPTGLTESSLYCEGKYTITSYNMIAGIQSENYIS